MSHEFKGVAKTGTFTYQGRCSCGYVTLPTPSKDQAYELLVDHFVTEVPDLAALPKSAHQGGDEPNSKTMLRVLPPVPERPPLYVEHQWVIGKDPECDIVVDDDYASAKHCIVLQYSDGTVSVGDLGSTNGTWVVRPATRSSMRVTDPVTLHPGDLLRIGRTVLKNIPGMVA